MRPEARDGARRPGTAARRRARARRPRARALPGQVLVDDRAAPWRRWRRTRAGRRRRSCPARPASPSRRGPRARRRRPRGRRRPTPLAPVMRSGVTPDVLAGEARAGAAEARLDLVEDRAARRARSQRRAQPLEVGLSARRGCRPWRGSARGSPPRCRRRSRARVRARGRRRGRSRAASGSGRPGRGTSARPVAPRARRACGRGSRPPGSTTRMRPVCLRAILSAVSLASVPLLHRNTRRRPAGASAASARTASGAHVVVRRRCCRRAGARPAPGSPRRARGWQWPASATAWPP